MFKRELSPIFCWLFGSSQINEYTWLGGIKERKKEFFHSMKADGIWFCSCFFLILFRIKMGNSKATEGKEGKNWNG